MAERPIRYNWLWLGLFIIAASLFVVSCADQLVSTLSPHEVDFFQRHGEAATADLDECRTCHGLSFQGIGRAISCFICHSEGEPFRIHRLPYVDPADHGPAAKANLTNCQGCHAEPRLSGPGSNPRFNVPIGNLVNGCEDCHSARTAHPTPLWVGGANSRHNEAGNLLIACSLCHGETLSGHAEGGVGHDCAECHEAGSPLTLIDCSSCHNKPPDSAPPAGNARPNSGGSHVEHNAISEITGLCNACHNGFGQNSANHFDGAEPADVSLLSVYDAKTGPAAYDSVSQTCGNVKCHGGQSTPNWLTGTINVALDCESCHELGAAAQTPQFNSAFSGRHVLHVIAKNKMCIECHDAGKLAPGHFSNLASSAFEGIAAQTLRDVVNYDGSSCSASAAGNCHGVEGPWF